MWEKRRSVRPCIGLLWPPRRSTADWGLGHRALYSSRSGGHKSKVKVWARRIPSEASLLGFILKNLFSNIHILR